jgi:hypothetical protein
MAERVGSMGAWNAEHGVTRAPHIVNDDLRLARVAVPLQGHCETVILACVEFNEHGV